MMAAEAESSGEQTAAEVAALHPGVSVSREMYGWMDIGRAGEDGHTPVERLQIHPYGERAVSVKLYTDLGPDDPDGKVKAELEVSQGEDGSTVKVKQAEPGVDIDEVMKLAQQGFELFDRYRALPRDSRFRVPGSKVQDDAKVSTYEALGRAGFDEGVARGMAGGDDESPEGQYHHMQPIISAKYRIESLG